jgi:diaminohydroxyphosphoribosylaminopyrimidine deaminase/5-amino-6-(5-phosphoribosylamino)uracil reductase
MAINAVFLKYITTKRPFVVMKTAMSLDGKIATYSGKSKWISSEKSREAVQYMRHSLNGIMVGINTVLADNPRLTCRLENHRNPVKIVVDSSLRIPDDAILLNDLPETRCIIAVADNYDKAKAQRLTSRGVEIIEVPTCDGKVDLSLLMDKLGEMKIDGILLEGGGTLNFAALESGIVDMYVAFIAPMLIGGGTAKTPVEGIGFEDISDSVRLEDVHASEYHGDILVYGKIRED